MASGPESDPGLASGRHPARRPVRILVALDGSIHARVSLEVVACLPLTPEDAVILLAVAEPDPATAHWLRRRQSRELDALLWASWAAERAAARRAVGDASQALDAWRTPVRQVIRSGPTVEVIVTAVAELGADLLAVGPRGRGRLAGLALGSVTHALLGRAPCPILVGRRPVAAPRKVVLGVDGSGNGREAARHLAEYPLAAGALVIVASVAPAGPSSSQSDAAARRAALAHATAAAAVVAAAGHATDVVVPAGKPAEEIIELARAADADLVAVGSRGHGAVRGFLLGSVSRHVVTGAPCSVLVAPPPRAGSPAAQGT